MSLISLFDACLSYSDAPLLDHAELHIEERERVCLVGRNGAGKSTLLNVLAKIQPLDDGKLVLAEHVVISRLQQDPPRETQGTIYDFVSQGVNQQAELLQSYHHLLTDIAENPSEANLTKLAKIQTQLDEQDAWSLDNQINQVLSKLNLDGDAQLSSLSGGWLRKAALAQALVCQPNVLLLDEPTNHLDIEAIKWLEDFLSDFPGSIIFISHDRTFIRKMASRIVDLDRGKLVSWPGNYEQYLLGKEEELRVEALQHAEFDKKLAQEEVWIRQGIKARRTRNEGRVRALKAMRQEYAERRVVQGSAKMQIESSTRSGKIIFDIESLHYQIPEKTLITELTTQVLRGDKIALVGPNGCGKTTLIKLMLDELKATSGRVHCGTKLEVAYFDQYRAVLDPEKTVMDNLAEGKQEVIVNGRSRHVLGYLQEFLFPPKRAMTPVKALSGGERNRLLLAKLFLKPSNLLILDEPTNDLDIETLELLEEILSDYQGTLLLVSHDRQFVDNVVTSCWMFEGEGRISIYPGGYHDAYQQQQQSISFNSRDEKQSIDIKKPENDKSATKRTKTKLSYAEQKELDGLPAQIEMLEKRLDELQQNVNNGDFFQQPFEVTQPILDALKQTEAQLNNAFERWDILESFHKG